MSEPTRSPDAAYPQDCVREAREIVRRWNERYGSLDRGPHPESFLPLDEERTLVLALDVLAARAERAERGQMRYRAALEEIARDVFSDRSLSATKCAYIARDVLEPVS